MEFAATSGGGQRQRYRQVMTWPPQLNSLPPIEIIETPRVKEREATDNPKLEAWYAVRQTWIANGRRVTPELLQLEKAAGKALDSRYATPDRNSEQDRSRGDLEESRPRRKLRRIPLIHLRS